MHLPSLVQTGMMSLGLRGLSMGGNLIPSKVHDGVFRENCVEFLCI